MKFEYTAPEMKLVEIQAENILTTSQDRDAFVADPWDVL